MRHFLVSFLLLLVPLALASSTLLVKLLYDRGYIIVENYDSAGLEYEYNEISFSFEPWDSELTNIGEIGPNFAEKDQPCKKNSKAELRHLIALCSHNTTLRSLTDEERKQLQEYKVQQKETKRPFEVIYETNRRIIKSHDARKVKLNLGITKNRLFAFYASLNPDDLQEQEHRLEVYGKPPFYLTNKTFIVEGLPADSDEECGQTDPKWDDVETKCKGKIKFRSV